MKLKRTLRAVRMVVKFPLLISGGLIEAIPEEISCMMRLKFPLLISGGLIEAFDIGLFGFGEVQISAAN